MALGVLDEIKVTGAPRPPVVGINAIPQAITAIVAGDLLATVNFDAMTMSCIATEAALRYLRGEKVPHHIMLPVRVIDRSNYGKLDLPFAKRTCQSWQEVMNTAAIT
jgi:ABC-type sugar transport system substrate-binding protein